MRQYMGGPWDGKIIGDTETIDKGQSVLVSYEGRYYWEYRFDEKTGNMVLIGSHTKKSRVLRTLNVYATLPYSRE